MAVSERASALVAFGQDTCWVEKLNTRLGDTQ